MNRPSWIGHALGGRYRIDELLGQGGMSAVYKATDPNLRRVVAVKLIHSHLSDDPEFVRRFEVEAAAVAQLRHPNIIQVFDFNSEADTYYMVLEFVPGETLQERLKRLNQQDRLMPLEDVLNIGASVADAIDYAHKRGMIHRDIKPANVMLNVQGEAILMDFGIAKMVGETHFTATGAVLGTALYMAPEQIRGERPDNRVDIYSLGVMLFEMVSGKPPFEADSAMTVMMMHLNDPVPELATLNPDLPPLLQRIIEKALAKDPEDRFNTASDLARALRSQLKQLQGGPAEAVAGVQGETIVEPPLQTGSPSAASQPAPVPVPAAGGSAPERPAVRPATPSLPQASRPAAGTGAMPGAGGFLAGLSRTQLAVIGGGLLLLAALAVTIIVLVVSGGNGQSNPPASPTSALAAAASETAQALALIPPTQTPQPATSTLTPTVTETPTPTESPTPTLTPTATVPSEPYVRIDDVGISDDHYVVIYQTFGYTEALPGVHIHFFWNTVSEENAGAPGSGPWTLYGGPRPFEDFRLASRPQSATQICARVANPNHSIIYSSGNCFDIPGL